MKIRNSKFEIRNCQKGVSLYLTVLIMAVLLALSLGISTLLYGQMKMMRGIGYSVIAFYTADTGIERKLYDENATSGYLDLNQNGARDEEDSVYNIQVVGPGEDDCPSNASSCIKSVGIYKKTRRAIQATR